MSVVGTRNTAREHHGSLALALVVALSLPFVPRTALGQSLDPDGSDEAAENGEEEPLVTIYGEVNFASRYAWRGLTWSRGLVMQPLLGVAGWGLDLWTGGNVPLTEPPSRGEFDEVDAGVTYTLEIPWFVLEATIQLWSYPSQEDWPTTGDIDVVLGVPVPLGDDAGTLTVFTLQSLDIGSYAGAYYGEFGLRHAIDVDDSTTLESSFLLGWASALFNETYVGPSIGAMNFMGVGFAATFYPIDYLYFRMHGQLTWLIEQELVDAVDDPVVAAAGLAVGAEYGF